MMGIDTLEAPEATSIGSYVGEHAAQEVRREPDVSQFVSGTRHITWETVTYSSQGTSQTVSVRALAELLDSVIETLMVVSDSDLMASIRRGIREASEGKGRPLNEVLDELGWE